MGGFVVLDPCGPVITDVRMLAMVINNVIVPSFL